MKKEIKKYEVCVVSKGDYEEDNYWGADCYDRVEEACEKIESGYFIDSEYPEDSEPCLCVVEYIKYYDNSFEYNLKAEYKYDDESNSYKKVLQ